VAVASATRYARLVAKSIHDTVREVCLSFPEAEEIISHGSPDYRVRGKSFASYVINHHGDGRVALWLNAPSGSQDHYVKSQPKHFFVPPYVGPRGWLGVHLDKGLSWERIASLVRQAYEKVAPRPLIGSLGETIEIKSPPKPLAPEEVNPLKSRRAQALLKRLRPLYLSWPEVSEDTQFGNPVWRAGKKTFAWVHVDRNLQAGNPRSSKRRGPRLQLYFWVGVAAQGLMTADERFHIPAYMGHNGWIALDVTDDCDWDEVRGLALGSYRHFAMQRMLKALDTGPDKRERTT
jgi:predicted DNA-binding protein (MmcQ/YjbR family)